MTALASIGAQPPATRWTRARLIRFRFAFALTVLCALHSSVVLPAYLFFDVLSRPAQAIISPVWFAETRASMSIGAFVISRLLGDRSPLPDVQSRYMQGLALLPYPQYARLAMLAYLVALAIVASLVTIVWSAADYRRGEYDGLNRWMRVSSRYVLALVAMIYAVVKVVPTQFGFLAPGEMLQPIGQLSVDALLWHFMSRSTLYTVFAGVIELVGVLLLFFRRTTLAGALLLGAALANVVVMDISYQVQGGGQVFAGLLLVLDLIVLAPYGPAIVSFLAGRAAVPPAEPGLVERPRRYSAAVSAVVFVLLTSIRLHDGVVHRRMYFGAGHPVYGLFDVKRFERNGAAIVPLASDGETWKRIGSVGPGSAGRTPLGLIVQLANAELRRYRLTDDTANQLWTLRLGATEVGTLRYTIEADATVSLDGRLGQDRVKMRLRRANPAGVPLLAR
jgi:hypothetical protein